MIRLSRQLVAVLVLLVWCSPAVTSAAGRVKARVTCVPAEPNLVYDCTITLVDRKTGEPVTGATVVVNADMPSMPMAHNVRPATAAPGAEPGVYQATLHLEMHGRWALRIRVSGPVRDQVVHIEEFGGKPPEVGGAQARYEGVGVVTRVDRAKSRLVIDHEEIEGFMAAMTMSYLVKPRTLLRGLKPGSKIRFTIDVAQRAIVEIQPLKR